MATYFVNPDGSADFTTILAAIGAALDGDTIVVSADIYEENLLIDKAVTIRGAQADVAGTDAGRDAAGGIGETTILGHSQITASGAVTIDGVRFLNDASTTGGGSIVNVVTGDNHVITDSIFYSAVNGAANGTLDIAIGVPGATGTLEISNNYFTGAFDGAFADASWGRGIFFSGGISDVTIAGNTFEFTRSGINLDMSGDSAATVAGNTFITNGTGTTVAIDFDNVSFSDNIYQDTREDFSFKNLTTDVQFDAEVAVAAVTPVNAVVDPVVVLGGTGNDTIRGTAGSDVLDGNASGNPVADNDTLEGRGGNDLLVGRGGDDTLQGGEGTDVLLGGAGNDVLDGEQGNDQVIGGDGDDTYIYRPGGATDTFNSFVAGLNTDDHVDISAFPSITSFAQVLSLATQVGEDTVIDFGSGDVLTLANVLKNSLAGEDFVLANAPPVITSNGGGDAATISLAENTTAVTTVTATDPDVGQTLSFSISDGADASKFTVDTSTGALSFVTAPNFEAPTDAGGNNVYDVTVQASDGLGGIDTQAIAVSVQNVTEISRAERFFDTATGDHFYTISVAEADQIRATLPTYHDEGAPWGTPEEGANTIDVFRFFDVATGTHFFTASTAERDFIIAHTPALHFEGVAFEAYSAPEAGTITLERFFNTTTGLHHLSASAAETASLHTATAIGAGWVDEGAGFIVHT